MITFLPVPNFTECAKILDRQRLGKQRLEAKWVAQIVLGETKYINHPLIRMWKPWPQAIIEYGICICEEWRRRGYLDNQLEWFKNTEEGEIIMPSWFGDDKLHSSHRTKLITKDPIYYSSFGWEEKPDPSVGYYWPL